MKRMIISIGIVFLLCSCGYDDFGGLSPDPFEGRTDFPNAELDIFRELQYPDRGVIAESFVFSCTVTANDKSGNYYRSFIVEDGKGAIEVRAGTRFVYNDYPVGLHVLIYAEGLAYEKSDGMFRLGREVESYTPYRIADFGSRVLLDRYVFRNTVIGNEVEPDTREIPQLNEWICGNLVRIEGVYYEGEEPALWADAQTASTSNVISRFVTIRGERIAVVTSTYADFAAEYIPFERKMNLTGILLYGEYGDAGADGFALKLRDIKDVEVE